MDLPGIEQMLSRLKLQDRTLRRQVAEGLRSGSPPPQALEFLAGLLTSRDPDIRDAAGNGLRESGARGVEVLMRSATQHPDPIGRAVSVRWLGESGVHGCFVMSATYHELGVDPGPVLKEALSDIHADVRKEALLALCELRPRSDQSRELAAMCLQDPDTTVRAAAASRLRGIHPLGTAIERSLETLLGDADSQTRLEAALALAGTGIQDDQVAQLLLKALDHLESPNRRAAASKLRHFPLQADSLVPALTRRLEDAEPEVRKQALHTLARFGISSVSSIPAIRKLLGWPDYVVDCINAMGRMGVPGTEVLSELLSSPTEETRYQVLMCLADRGADARGALPGILRCLDDDVARVRYRASQCLVKISPDHFMEVVSRIRQASEFDRTHYAWYLAEVGESAMVVFQELAKDEDPLLRELSAKGLARMKQLKR